MKIEGNAVFDHCYFSGPIIKKNAGINTFTPFKSPFNKITFLYVVIALVIFVLLFYFLKKKFWNFS